MLRLQYLLAVALYDEGAYQEAESIVEGILQNVVSQFGENHEFTIDVYDRIMCCARGQGKYGKEQDIILNKILPFFSERHGEQSPEMASQLHNLGISFGNLGLFEKRREVQQKVIHIYDTHPNFGPMHEKTRWQSSHLASSTDVLVATEKSS